MEDIVHIIKYSLIYLFKFNLYFSYIYIKPTVVFRSYFIISNKYEAKDKCDGRNKLDGKDKPEVKYHPEEENHPEEQDLSDG